MTRMITTRRRVLRIREREARIAAAKAAQGQTARAKLISIASRIDGIAAALGSDQARTTTGAALHGVCELGDRLATARTAMVTPIADADTNCARLAARHGEAVRASDTAASLLDRAVSAATREAERRADANRPFRARQQRLAEDAS